MLRLRTALLVIAAGLALAGPAGAVLEREVGPSGLPIPRYVSLRADEVNVRTGPGPRYPVEWIFVRRNMPVEIIAEFDTWRKVRDWQDTEGWVHKSMLSGRRTIIVIDDIQTLRRDASPESPAVARAEPGVVGRLSECREEWCLVDIGGFEGWLRRVEFWGTYPEEEIE